jgi:hypothetical protein
VLAFKSFCTVLNHVVRTRSQAALHKLMASAGPAVPLAEYIPAKLLLARAQLFQGKLTVAMETCSDAVVVCEGSRGFTPDTEALAAALHHLGVMQLLTNSTADAETSLVRAARLGNTEADHAKVCVICCYYSSSTLQAAAYRANGVEQLKQQGLL